MTSFVRPEHPTAIVSYSHSEARWEPERAEGRLQQVHRLVFALRSVGGISADADIFHPNEDWTRWGPAQVDRSDFILVIASPAWRDAWIGAGDELTNKGLRAEADAVRSIEQAGRSELQKRLRFIILPGSSDADIPLGLHGIARYQLNGFELDDLEPLLRDLTNQPKFLKPTVGDIPVFPPAMTTQTPDIAGMDDKEPSAPSSSPPATTSAREKEARIQQLRDQLAALPDPLPGEGPHLPWYRLREQIERRLFIELSDATEPAQRVATATNVTWIPTSNVHVGWAEQWRPGITYGASSVVLHLVPVPQVTISQRTMASLDETMTALLHSGGLLKLGAGFSKSFPGDDAVIEMEISMRGYNEVALGMFLGCRAGRSGQVSIWFSLPRDRIGAVLDEGTLLRDLEKGLGVGGRLMDAIHGDQLGRVALAAELINVTMLTDGRLEELGIRSGAGLPGALGGSARMQPDESVELQALRGPSARVVAAQVAKVIVRAWGA